MYCKDIAKNETRCPKIGVRIDIRVALKCIILGNVKIVYKAISISNLIV